MSHGFGHQVLHVSILVATLVGAAGLVLLVVWPLISDGPLPAITRNVLAAFVALAVILLLLEWRVVH
jgi:hypothetical protein